MNEAAERRTCHRTVPSETKTIRVNERKFILKDISREGIGVLIENAVDFFIGQRIASILLENDADARSLAGIVNHMSQDASGIVCGIRFDFRNNSEFNYVETIHQTLSKM